MRSVDRPACAVLPLYECGDSLQQLRVFWHKSMHRDGHMARHRRSRIHQEKRFCAPKSRQKLEYLFMSLCSVWAGLRFCHTCEKLSVVSELTCVPLSTLSPYMRKKNLECQITLPNHDTLCGISIVF